MSKIIYVYSKFSQHCKELEPIVSGITDINMLCVDNNISRSRVLQNKELNIQVVPTIIIINDTIKIYEGENAKEYIYQVYTNINSIDSESSPIENVIQEDNVVESSLIENVIEEKNVIDSESSLIENVIDSESSLIENVIDNESSLIENVIDSESSLIENVIEEDTKNEDNENDLMSLVESMQKERENLEKINS